MRHAYTFGTGESHVHSNTLKREILNNMEIDLIRDGKFLMDIFLSNNLKVYTLHLLPPKVRRWGTCFPDQKKVCIYRHDVNTLLHEYAHAFVHEKYGEGHGHDSTFGEVLDNFIESWWTKHIK